MTERLPAEGLLVSIPIFLGSAFVISFVVCLCLFWRSHQAFYKSLLASVVTTHFDVWLAFVFFAMYTAPSYVSWHEAAGSVILLSTLLLPQVVLTLILVAVVGMRHFRSPDKSYKIEALGGLFVATMGAAWTTIAAEALNVAD
jgi:hypothetical protein